MLNEYYSIVPPGEHWKPSLRAENLRNTAALLQYTFMFHFDRLFPNNGSLALMDYHLNSYPSTNRQSRRFANRSTGGWPASECRLRRGCDGCDPHLCNVEKQCVQPISGRADFRTCMSKDATWQRTNTPCTGVYNSSLRKQPPYISSALSTQHEVFGDKWAPGTAKQKPAGTDWALEAFQLRGSQDDFDRISKRPPLEQEAEFDELSQLIEDEMIAVISVQT
jgi:hypothetical protein